MENKILESVINNHISEKLSQVLDELHSNETKEIILSDYFQKTGNDLPEEQEKLIREYLEKSSHSLLLLVKMTSK